jgi:hypothetical protein
MRLAQAIVAALGFLLLCGCMTRSVTVTRDQDLRKLVGHHVTITGTALHSCPGAIVSNDGCQVVVDGLKFWPATYDHQQVQVTGLLQESRIPGLFEIRNAKWTLSSREPQLYKPSPSFEYRNSRSLITIPSAPASQSSARTQAAHVLCANSLR